MNVIDRNSLILENYIGLMDSLSHDFKIDLISHLSQSLKTKDLDKAERFKKSFNSWKSDETAEEINDFLMKSRKFNRKRMIKNEGI